MKETEKYARFLYFLPMSKNQALVEYTIFSPEILSREEYDAALRQYVEEKLFLKDYQVKEEEFGVIPMTDNPMPPQQSSRIIPIGTLAGAVKPTTGYAFLRIQKQVQQIANKLEKGLDPAAAINVKRRFKF